MINYESLVRILKNGGFRESNSVTEENGTKFVDFTSRINRRVIYTAILNPKYPGTAEKLLKTDVATATNNTPKPVIVSGLAELKKLLNL